MADQFPRFSGRLKCVPTEADAWRTTETWWVEDPCIDLGKYPELHGPDGSGRLLGNRLTIDPGFEFDGGSFVAIDDEDSMAGYLAHDWLYRACRHGLFGTDWPQWRAIADRLMTRIHKAKGKNAIRRFFVWLGVRIGARGSAKPRPDAKVEEFK